MPGHGRVTVLAKARSQTRANLKAWRAHIKRAVERNVDVGDTVKSFDAKPFMHPSNAAEPNPGNASRTFLEVDRV